MTELQRMKTELQNNLELQRKFEEAKKKAAESGAKSDCDILANAAQAIGYTIPLSEFEKELAEAQKLSDEELSSVCGGVEDEYGHDDWCGIFWHCYATFLHTTTENHKVACWKDYSCRADYK